MVIILNRNIKRQLLYITDNKDEIEALYKVLDVLKRNMLAGPEAFIRYLIRNIDGFFWSVNMVTNEAKLTLRVLLEETPKGPTIRIIGLPEGYNKSALSIQFINKVLELKDISNDEKMWALYALGKLVDRLVMQFLSAFDLEPGVNVIEIDNLYFEDENVYFIIGDKNAAEPIDNK